GEAIDRLRLAEASERKLTERHDSGRAMARELSGEDGRSFLVARQPLQACRQVYRRPDAGKVEPVRGADIAVEHIADVQGDAVARACTGPIGERCDRVPNLRCGAERGPAHVAWLGIPGERENREETVAHEFEDLAAVTGNRR